MFSQKLRGPTCLPPLPRETLIPPQAITRGLPHPLPTPHHELPSKKGCAAALCLLRERCAISHQCTELRGSVYNYRDSTFQLTFSALNLRVFPVSSTTRVIAISVNEKCVFVSVGLSIYKCHSYIHFSGSLGLITATVSFVHVAVSYLNHSLEVLDVARVTSRVHARTTVYKPKCF